LKMWQSLNVWEQQLKAKIAFTKKLYAGCLPVTFVET